MRRVTGWIVAATFAFLIPAASFAKDQDIDEKSAAVVDQAYSAIQNGRPDKALELLTPVLADYEKAYASEKRKIYCAQTPEQSITYMAMAAAEKKGDAIAIKPGWCTAQFVRAFALVDLKRLDDAQAAFERLIEFAPHHSRYLNELGFVFLTKRQWQTSMDYYARADAAADLTPDRRDIERCTAFRGIGYDLVELGRLDDAEAAYRKCLAIMPDEPKSLGEIEYIKQQRKKNI